MVQFVEPRRLTQRGRERRNQIMEFAALRFAENGYHPTSVADIVDQLGVGKGVFYWYFESKEELFVEILKDAQLSLRRKQQQAIANEVDPVKRIEQGMYATMRWLAANRHVFNLFQFAATEKAFSTVLRNGQETGSSDTMRHVKDGIIEGRFRDGDPFMITHAIIGVSNELASRCIYGRGEDPDEVAEQAVAFCLRGLLAH
jgi:AcrR family transcriptional regulator